jgi:TonB family protein
LRRARPPLHLVVSVLAGLLLFPTPGAGQPLPDAPPPAPAPAPAAAPAPAPAAAPTPAPAAAPAPAPAAAPAPALPPTLVPPQLTRFVHADYPPAAQAAGQEAAVVLQLALDAQGAVQEVTVLAPAGDGFDEAAVAAARQLGFTPATVEGQPVPVTIRFTYRFVLETQPTPAPATTHTATTPEADAAPAATPPTLRGRVLRRGSREPWPGVGVQVAELELTAETDADGRFALALPPGRHTLRLLHPDLLPYSTTEEVGANEVLDATYYAEAKPTSHYRAVVTASRPAKTVTRTTLQSVELVKVPGTFGEPFRVVQALPGVGRTPFGLGFLIVRGSAPADTGFFIDGHEVPLLYHFLSGPAVFQAELVSSIDFYPGNFPVSFGRKQAGLVTARTKDAEPGEQVHGLVSLDLLDVEALVKVPLGEEQQVTAAFRRSHFDLFLPLFTNAVSPRYWDYQLVGSSRLGGSWRGKLTLFGSSDTLDFNYEPETQDDPGSAMEAAMGIRFHRVHASLLRPVGDGGKLELSLKGGVDTVELVADSSLAEVDLWEGTLRGELTLPLRRDRLTLHAGVELDGSWLDTEMDIAGSLENWTDWPHPWGSGEDPQEGRLGYSFDGQAFAPAAYASLELEFGRLTLIPGLRADVFHYEDWTRFVVDPRLIVRHQLLETLSLKGGIGLFHQLEIGQQTDSNFGSPDDVEAPYAVQYSVGIESKPLEYFDIDASFFYNDYRNQLHRAESTETDGLATGAQGYSSEARGRAYGLELLLRHRPHHGFFGWIAYTLSRAERQDPGRPWTLFALDQTHILTAVASYALSARWNVGLKFQLTSGIPTTPILGGVLDADTGDYSPIFGRPGEAREPLFHQLDLRVDRLWLFDRWKLTAYLDLLNLYNSANTEFTVYNYDYSQSGGVTGIPIFPSLGVKGEF